MPESAASELEELMKASRKGWFKTRRKECLAAAHNEATTVINGFDTHGEAARLLTQTVQLYKRLRSMAERAEKRIMVEKGLRQYYDARIEVFELAIRMCGEPGEKAAPTGNS